MRIHLGTRKTGRTACGKPLARRWWVPLQARVGFLYGPAGLVLVRELLPADLEINCKKCKEAV